MPEESMPKYALQNGEITEVDPKDVEYEFYSFNNFHGLNANAIPMMTAVQAPRINYGQRFMTQAMPLADPEEPLVQAKLPDSNQSFDQSFGRSLGAVFNDSFDNAVVQSVTPDEIKLKGDNGEVKSISLYRNYPFNRKSMVTNTPLVQPGQTVKKGQLLAKSNFTNDKGNFALGKNLRVGIVPYRGYSMDDAIVLSQSAANKLTSVHTYTKELQEDGDNLRIDRDQFVSMFPTKFTKDQLDKLDEQGLPKVGTIIEKGDPLILATRPKTISSKSMDLSNLSRVNRVLRTDASEVWDHDDPAEVLDTVITKDGVRKVILSSKSPAQVGDKIAMRSGQKDIISKIIPDDQMLRGEDGKPLEILLNPQSLPSRANTALVYEILGGKIAEKLGKKLIVPSVPPPGTKWFDVFGDLLHKNGLNDTETVYDPVRDRNLSNPITVGNAYVMKLHHVVSSKFSSRNQGGYDLNEQPTKGGKDGSKRFSGLEVNAMLSSGAYANLREGATIRGQRNDEYWRAIREGRTPQEPGTPFVFRKFLAMLAGSGMFAKEVGDGKLRLGPMTDKLIEQHKPIEVQNSGMVDLGTLRPKKGSLFSDELTGTNAWGKITLREPLPNPAFEPQIMSLLGLKKNELRAILSGEMELPPHVLERLKKAPQ